MARVRATHPAPLPGVRVNPIHGFSIMLVAVNAVIPEWVRQRLLDFERGRFVHRPQFYVWTPR